MKKITFLVSAMFFAFSGVLVSCTANDELEAETVGYSYSASDVEEILELQAEYGVEFEFKKFSYSPLPSVDDMESLCKLIVAMQSSVRHGVKVGNGFVFSTGKQKQNRTRSLSWDIEKYSGSHSDVEYDGDCGEVRYTVEWSDVYVTRDGGLSGSVTCDIDCNSSDWDVSVYDFDYHFEGTSTLVFEIEVQARIYSDGGAPSYGIGDSNKDFVRFTISGECSI